MSAPDLTAVSAQVQIVGQWNPSIFQPRWFSEVSLLPKEEAENAKILIIHEEIAHFTLPWLNLQVTRDRLVASTTQESYSEPLRDLVLGTLDLLSHTPTRMMGINHDYLLTFADRSTFDALGWKLVPPQSWPGLKRPGVATMQVQGERQDDNEGYVRVKVEPILDATWRVIVGVNDHYQLSSSDTSRSTELAMQILSTRWQDARSEALALVSDLRAMETT